MRTHTLQASAIILALVCATKASAEVVFQGSIAFKSVTAGCRNFQAGWKGRSQYHPRLSGNGDFTAISVIFDYSASSYGINGEDFTTKFQNVFAAASFWGPNTWNGSQVKLTSARDPAVIKSTTRFVTLTGQLKMPENDPGGAACIATFEAAYVRDPNN